MDVDTTSSHVGGHQDILGPGFQVGESKLTLLLAFAAMQGAGIVLWNKVGVSRSPAAPRAVLQGPHGGMWVQGLGTTPTHHSQS